MARQKKHSKEVPQTQCFQGFDKMRHIDILPTIYFLWDKYKIALKRTGSATPPGRSHKHIPDRNKVNIQSGFAIYPSLKKKRKGEVLI
jgi:hypothetical protein